MDTTGNQSRTATPILTWALIVANVAVFRAMVSGGVPRLDAPVTQLEPWGASVVHLVAAGQWWRLLSSMFLHASGVHLLGSIVSLWLVGRSVERHLGSATLAVIYLFSGLAGGVVTLLTGGTMVGASGGICGMEGCLVVLALRGYPVRRLLLVVLVLDGADVLLLLTAPSLLGNVQVAHWAHLVGFVAGLAASGLCLPPREGVPGASARRWTSRLASLGLVIVVLGGAVAHVLRDQMRTCSPRVDRLRARLSEVEDRAGYEFGEQTRIAPSSPFGRPAQELGPVLRIAAGTMFLDDRAQGQIDRADTIASVESALETLARGHGALDREVQRPETPLYVIAEAGMEAHVLIDTLRMLPAMFGARLLVRAPQWTSLDPIPEGASAELETSINQILEAKPEQRPPLLTSLLLSANQGCQPLQDIWGRVAAAEPSAKDDVVRREAPPAIETCSCLGVDVDVLEAVLLVLLTPTDPPVRWLPIRFEDAARHTEQPITLHEGSTVADLARDLGAADSAQRSVYFSRKAAADTARSGQR